MSVYHFSKSRYCSCIQCPKILWLKEHLPDEFDDSVMNQSVLSTGNDVGDLAMGLFGDYTEVPFTEKLGDMIPATQRLIDEGVKNICEASFSYDGCFCSVDILRNLGNKKVELYEVKSSTSVHWIYEHDVSYQYYVLTKLGYDVQKVCLVHIDTSYVRHGDLELDKLFKIEDLTDIAKSKLTEVEENIKKFREYAKIIHINFYMPIGMYADKIDAVKYGAELVFHGADSMLPMGVTNETLKYMTDNYVPVFGHIGAISGWQTNATGYKKVGKTAEDAFKIFKWGYEYQENGMGAMTIELTPMEVSQAIAEKLRVPVISIAGGAPCDGSEMVDMDTFGVMPKPASHAVCTAELLPFLCEAYADWADMVREGDYPEDKHGYHMDPEELEIFNAMMDAFEA